MHELSIAMSVLDAVQEQSERQGGKRVTAVRLRVGPLSGVVVQALAGAFELAREGTEFADCRLEIEETAVMIRCPKCGVDRAVESIQLMACSVCGTASGDVGSGREREGYAMEIEE